MNALEISPAFSRDQTVIASVRENLIKSVDGGRSWRRLTLGLGLHSFTDIAFSPAFEQDQTVFVASYGGGVRRSNDGGLHWAPCDAATSGPDAAFVAVSPGFAKNRTVAAVTFSGKLLLSEDAGDHWRVVHEEALVGDPTAIETFYRLHGHLKSIGITAVNFAGDALLFGTLSGELRSSRDGGRTWSSGKLSQNRQITLIAPVEDRLFIGTDGDGLLEARRTADGFTFHPTGLTEKNITSFASVRDAAGTLVLMASDWREGVYLSQDGGSTWHLRDDGLTTMYHADYPKYQFPHFHSLRPSDGYARDATILLGGFDGLFRSTDGGERWRGVRTLSIAYVVGLELSPVLERDGKPVFEIGLASYVANVYSKPSDASIEDAGQSWKIEAEGLNGPRLSALAYSPDYANDGVKFAVGAAGLVARSEHGGAWRAHRVPQETLAWLYLAFRNRVRSASDWAAQFFLDDLEGWWSKPYLSEIDLSPGFARDQTLFVGSRAHGIYRSQDGGREFERMFTPPGNRVFSVVVSPAYEEDGTVFLSSDEGVYRSTDRGDEWQSLGDPKALHRVKLAISPAYGRDATLYAGNHNGLFVSKDRGESWSRLGLTVGQSDVTVDGISLSPAFGEEPHMLVRTNGEGLHRSKDGGVTFEVIGDGPEAMSFAFTHMARFTDRETVPMIAFSPRYATDRTIYASSMVHLFRSTDAGNTWQVIPRPIRFEQKWARYEGTWRSVPGGGGGLATASSSTTPGDTAALWFDGSGLRWIGSRGPAHGIAKVAVDGGPPVEIDLYQAELETGAVLWSVEGLSSAEHRLRIEVLPRKNPASTGSRVDVDAIEVLAPRRREPVASRNRP